MEAHCCRTDCVPTYSILYSVLRTPPCYRVSPLGLHYLSAMLISVFRCEKHQERERGGLGPLYLLRMVLRTNLPRKEGRCVYSSVPTYDTSSCDTGPINRSNRCEWLQQVNTGLSTDVIRCYERGTNCCLAWGLDRVRKGSPYSVYILFNVINQRVFEVELFLG